MKLTLKSTLSEVMALATAAGALRAARFLKMCLLPFPFNLPDAPTAAVACAPFALDLERVAEFFPTGICECMLCMWAD